MLSKIMHEILLSCWTTFNILKLFLHFLFAFPAA